MLRQSLWRRGREDVARRDLHRGGSVTHCQMAGLTKNRAHLVIIRLAEFKFAVPVGGAGSLPQQFKAAGLARRAAINAVSGEVMDGARR